MKLVRFGPPGREKPGVWLTDGLGPGRDAILDVRRQAFDIEDYNAHFFSHWGLERIRALLNEADKVLLPAAGARLGPPVAAPSKIICVGKNFADHAAEFDGKAPDQPILFAKAPSALIGPTDPIRIAPGEQVDIEVELAVVMGRKACRISEAEAWDFIAGYTVLNDVTDRRAQRADGQWFRAKSVDTFCPLGPFLVTRDEIADPHALQMSSAINGASLQRGSTAQMIYKIPALLAFITSRITLEPGDIVSTGTPGGIGAARTPPVFLKPGDTVEIAIESLGHQVNPVELAAKDNPGS